MDFEKTRTRLYRLSFAINAVLLPGFLAVIAFLGNATEPVVQWPTEIARFFTPGLLTNLIAAGLKFPIPTIMLAVVIGAIFWMNRVVELEENEHAFQTWLRFGLAAPPPVPTLAARIIARIAGIWWLLFILVLLVLMFGPGLFSDASAESAAQSEEMSMCAESECPCIGACEPYQLARGETVHVMIAAKRQRNETGLLLAKGETYMARFICSKGWRDGNNIAQPRGVEFEWWTRYLVKGVEWLRPYPQGDWFQLIGRIDRGRDVFPILDQQDPKKSFSFRVPEDGELVLLVNDVIYGNNHGFLTVEIGVGSGP